MSESFLTSSINSAAFVNGTTALRESGQQEQQSTSTTQSSANPNYNYGAGDEFVTSLSGNASQESYFALQDVLEESDYNKLTSSFASELYEQVSSSITSLFSGNKTSKINQKANEDYAYFNGDDTNEFEDLGYFAEEMGNTHITSMLKEYEAMKELLGVSDEEIYTNT